MRKILLTLFLTYGFIQIGLAQEPNFKINNARKSIKIVEEFINAGSLDKALKQLDHTIDIKPDFAISYRLKGAVLYFQNHYAEAIEYYEKSFELDPNLSRAALFECAECYLFLENITKAEEYYKKYADMKGKSYANAKKESGMEVGYDNLLKTRQENCQFFTRTDKNRFGELRIKHYGKNINSKYDDYLPCTSNDGEYLIFTKNIRKVNEDIYIAHRQNNNNTWSVARPFSHKINTNRNEGMAKFQTVGNTFFFAGHNDNQNIEDCNILQANFNDGKVSDFYELQGDINTLDWDSQPAITCDGTKLFFASNRPDGYGGSDIWMSELDEETGEWKVAHNLGPVINTAKDEESPYIANDGLTIYFSSDGHPGFGNGDLFISRFVNGKWTKPENLGYPINSAGKELGIFIQNDDQTTWIASERLGTHGGLDIYSFTMPSEFAPSKTVPVAVHVLDKIENKGVTAKVIISNNGNRFVRYTDVNGDLEFCLPGNQGYSFQVSNQDYDPLVEAAYVDADKNVSLQTINLYLTPYDILPEPIAFNEIRKKKIEIYFDFNSSKIPDEYLADLMDLSELIDQYDGWTVEAYGYADNVGNADYNKKLSKERAQNVVDFISKNCNKIIQSNVQTVGKGSVNSSSTNDKRFSRKVEVILQR